MKKIILIPIISVLLSGCFWNKFFNNEEKPSSETVKPSAPIVETDDYIEKSVNIYRQKDKIDKSIPLRFYKTSLSIPYISVYEYFNEFYNTRLKTSYENHKYIYYSITNAYLSFNIDSQELSSNDLSSFSYHPDFIERTGKLYIRSFESKRSELKDKTISLKKYSISIYEDNNNAYVPLSLLSSLIGGTLGYDVSYNGKDVFVLDYGGQLGTKTSPKYFSDFYFKSLNEINEPRPIDVINYSYNELCFVFDNLRGETEQLFLGEENLNELGLDGALTRDYQKIKEYLLSSRKDDYYEGYKMLMLALSDGGHTGIPQNTIFNEMTSAAKRNSEDEFVKLKTQTDHIQYLAEGMYMTFSGCKYKKFGVSGNYYLFDNDSKTAYVGFDSFDVDYEGWDDYYNGRGDIPVNSDTYAFVRDKMIKAKSDGATNLILDITTNLGGSSYALEAIVALFNKARGYIKIKNTFNDYIISDTDLIDINLDGKWDDEDANVANSFNFNVGVLTSPVAFSCGNLFPYQMKELGYKIVGEKTGGGSCAISYDTTVDGIGYVHSSYLTLVDQNSINIDGGVDVDYKIEMKPTESDRLYDVYDYYDFEIVSNILGSL